MVDLGGSLAVASHGVFNTGVSTDINVTYLANSGAVGEKIRATAVLDRSRSSLSLTCIFECLLTV